MKLVNVVAESGGGEAGRDGGISSRVWRTLRDKFHAIDLDGLAILQRGLQLFTQALSLGTGEDEPPHQRSEVGGCGLRGELQAGDSGRTQKLGKALFAGCALEGHTF